MEAGETPADWLLDGLPRLPEAMQQSGARESGASRAVVDLVEALVLQPLVGRQIQVAVVAVDDESSTVVCRDPAVQARVNNRQLGLGDEVQVTVVAADPVERRVELEPT